MLMFAKRIYAVAVCFLAVLFPLIGSATIIHKNISGEPRLITFNNAKTTFTIDYNHKAAITSLIINGQKVVSSADGMFTSVKIGAVTYSSLQTKNNPVIVQKGDSLKITGINYGDKQLNISETWTFVKTSKSIKWKIERSFSKAVNIDEAAMPVINFDNINTWEGAYQGYGGLAWFYLFNEKLCTYGVHTSTSNFWNSKTNNGLNITVGAPGEQVAMKYTRTNDDRLQYSITASKQEMLPRADTGTNRRRFIRGRTNVWAPFFESAGKTTQTLTFSYFDYDEKYGRGKFTGINGGQVSAVLGTIAHIGVIDSLHYGGNSWHTPYGPICLHEQYIAQLGLGINDPAYLNGYKSCLDFYRDHAIKPDGRVYPRWAYTNEDAMPGLFNKDGFYEARWGFLLDSNPDYVSNVSELYDLTGDKRWVKGQQLACEKALEWILKRDSNHNGLVEMMTDSKDQKKSSDWIDIIWASYENAFVNAKLYHALVKWAAIEHQLGNNGKAVYYEKFATKLKVSFNKPTSEGGFWDEEKKCYVHWRDKDNTIHGRNMVTPVNFMAIAYDICDNVARKKLILDNIETQMQQENLFFWPLAMTSYAAGEGKEWQFPFPGYENGDLFLSWGALGVEAYAGYNPAIALKYVKKVLEQYSKDGLAFQRYGRVKQDGLGDDILSGNSLSIVGLYQAIYGINPLYNRFYLEPHITPELYGTELRYNFHNQHLTINLDSNGYAVSNHFFKVMGTKNFGFAATKNRLSYFDGNNATASLQITTDKPLTIAVKNWSGNQMEWTQSASIASVKPVSYLIGQLKPNALYIITVNGNTVQKAKSDTRGNLLINHRISKLAESVRIYPY
jgi:hypothetical protein